MNIEHHDLAHEFPEHRQKIHSLKIDNTHFSKLFEAYHVITKDIERLEGEGVPVSDAALAELKKERALLKDQLYAMIIA